MLINRENLKLIVAMDTLLLYDHLVMRLQGLGYNTILADGFNYMVAVPDLNADNYSPITLVGHIDTVRKVKGDKPDLYFIHNRLFNKEGILGADDRAGIYGILTILENTDMRPIVIFTNGEERGGIGVKRLIHDNILDDYAEHIHLFVELDRQGYNDFVFYYKTQPKEVTEFAKFYGYEEAGGSYSDVADLSPAYMIPHLNLSIGYWNQHRQTEFLDIAACNVTINNVISMLDDRQCPKVKLMQYHISYYNSSSSSSSSSFGGGPHGVYGQHHHRVGGGGGQKALPPFPHPKENTTKNGGGTGKHEELETTLEGYREFVDDYKRYFGEEPPSFEEEEEEEGMVMENGVRVPKGFRLLESSDEMGTGRQGTFLDATFDEFTSHGELQGEPHPIL